MLRGRVVPVSEGVMMKFPLHQDEIERLRTIVSVLKKHEGDFLVHELRLKHLLPGRKAERGKEKDFYQPPRIRKIFEELGGNRIALREWEDARAAA